MKFYEITGCVEFFYVNSLGEGVTTYQEYTVLVKAFNADDAAKYGRNLLAAEAARKYEDYHGVDDLMDVVEVSPMDVALYWRRVR